MAATATRASATRVSRSSSLTSRPHGMIQAKPRSTTRRRRVTKPLALWRATDDPQVETDLVLRRVDQASRAAAVVQNELDDWKGSTEEPRHALRAVSVPDVGGADFDGEKAAVGAGHDGPLAPADAPSGRRTPLNPPSDPRCGSSGCR